MRNYQSGSEFFDEQSKKLGLPTLDDIGDSVNGTEFEQRRLPMVVACSGCEMTMTFISPSVRIDDDGYVWCRGCTGEDDDA